jgi:hypothetical protein
MAQDSNVVIDHGKSQWSDLWKKEDYLAIWLGFIIIAVSILAYTTFGPKAEFAEKIAAADQIQEAELPRHVPDRRRHKARSSGNYSRARALLRALAHLWNKTPGAWKTTP